MEKQDLILLPSHNQCLALMEAHGMLPNIREHSFRVMEVASFLGEALVEAGFDLFLPLVTAGALLHDLGKTQCLGTLTNHAELGAGILEELGYPYVAQVVREHVHLHHDISDTRPLREAELVNYADKRVLHETVVTLEERFADLKVRYGRTPEALARIQVTEVRARALEEKLFAPLQLSPLDLLRVNGEKFPKTYGKSS
ncbi:MAG: HD domain-containing protein [Deltaproteobacteria bacterium]|nr:HD domain-containing protein [Deltaproteobacteria bacterium]